MSHAQTATRTLGEVFHEITSEDRTCIKANLRKASLRIGEMEVIPIVNQEELDLRRVELSDRVQAKLENWLSFPYRTLTGRVAAGRIEQVVNEVCRYELNRNDQKSRKLPESVRLMMVGGVAVGILPLDLHAASNEEFVDCVRSVARREKFELDDAQVHRFNAGEGSFRIDATFPRFVAEPKQGDIVRFGISLKHNSVGMMPSSVSCVAYRLVCSNGMVSPVCLPSGQKMRIRRSTDDGAEKTLDRIREATRQAFRNVGERIQALNDLAKERVDVREAIEQFIVTHRQSKHVRDELLGGIEHGDHGGDDTAFGFVNLLSRLATHGPRQRSHRVPMSVRRRIETISGVYAGQHVHQCPSCRRILAPSEN